MRLSLCLLPLLCAASLLWGSIPLSPSEVWHALTSGGADTGTAAFIVCGSRLPQLFAALIAGSALGAAGLVMQTLFRNPLADPSLLGVNAGAGLGAAVAVLLLGGAWTAGGHVVSGYLLTTLAAFLGAVAVVALLMLLSGVLRGTLHLLVAGVMISFFASSVVSVLTVFATAEGVRSFALWGLGDFTGVTSGRLPFFALVAVLCLVVLFLQLRSLNALQLGADYARSLGIHTRRARTLLLLTSGMLAAVVTALCGPVSFVGLAAPHIARLTGAGANHRRLLPATLLWGADIAVAAMVISRFPGGVLPLNAVTSLIGVPLVIWLLVRR